MPDSTTPTTPAPDRPDHDPRFILGLALDVAKVLERHGYDGITTNGCAFVELQHHLLHFLHGREQGYDSCMGGVL